MVISVLARFESIPASARQFIAYAVIGAGTTSLDALLFAIIVSVAGWRDDARSVLASTLSYGTASVIAYFLNSRIAFRDQHRGDDASTLARFAATFASSALLSALVFSLVRIALAAALPALGLEGSTLPLAGAKIASIVTVIIWNFTLLRLWVFRAQPASPADA